MFICCYFRRNNNRGQSEILDHALVPALKLRFHLREDAFEIIEGFLFSFFLGRDRERHDLLSKENFSNNGSFFKAFFKPLLSASLYQLVCNGHRDLTS